MTKTIPAMLTPHSPAEPFDVVMRQHCGYFCPARRRADVCPPPKGLTWPTRAYGQAQSSTDGRECAATDRLVLTGPTGHAGCAGLLFTFSMANVRAWSSAHFPFSSAFPFLCLFQKSPSWSLCDVSCRQPAHSCPTPVFTSHFLLFFWRKKNSFIQSLV